MPEIGTFDHLAQALRVWRHNKRNLGSPTMSADYKTNAKPGFATRAIHHGYDPQSHNGALNQPV
ncbi:MAG TPA: hypothetical protein DEF21_03995, partial [Thalassospira lucentensis]|nr:hypothetical protein [Thalassospira lucentensis]